MSVAVLRALLAALAAAGVDADALVKSLGVAYETLLEPESRVPTELAFRVFADAPRLTGDPYFGLHAGAGAPLGTFEVLDHATRTSRTIGEALSRTVRFYALLIERIELRLVVDAGRARITHRAPPPIVPPRAAVEMLFAIIIARGEVLTGARWPLERAAFVHEAPADTSELTRFFRAPLAFGQPEDALEFDARWLDQPLLTADPGVADALDRFASTLLPKDQGDRGSRDVPDGVRRAIAETLEGTAPSLDATARRLGQSGRTLQRKLAAAGTTYQLLVEEVRRDLAARYLADPRVTVQEVGYLLGFSDPTAFTRAFRRWEGQSPSEHRSARLAASPAGAKRD